MNLFERTLMSLTFLTVAIACTLLVRSVAHADTLVVTQAQVSAVTDDEAVAAYDECIDQADTTYADCEGV